MALVIELGVIFITASLAIGGFIWMLKNHERRLGRTEDRLAETDKRVNNHDIIFEVIKLDLEYMKKGIDLLQEGQTRLEEQHRVEMNALKGE